MKMKSFAMLAVSGFLAASCAYIAPAMADDMSDNGQQMQAAPSDMQSGAGDNMSSNNNLAMGSSNSMSSGNSSGGTDQASPDTATGDDDY